MNTGHPAVQLREQGVVLLRDVFRGEALVRLREAAECCFTSVECGDMFPERFGFNRFSNSMLLGSLEESGGGAWDELTAPLRTPCVGELLDATVGPHWRVEQQQCWVRKKFAPGHAPDRRDVAQGWRQDGALGVRFPQEICERDEQGYWVPALPMTELVTCWIPLDACGVYAPGLEFARGPQPGLLHFTELDDARVRRRFAAERFWAPEMKFGDGVVFLNSMLHRTYVSAEMTRDRVSVEYRIFPA